MDTAEIAQKMLDVLTPNTWIRGTLYSREGRITCNDQGQIIEIIPVDRFCLAGARMSLDMPSGAFTDSAPYAADEYLRLLARIITEQYGITSPDESALGIIFTFNDDIATFDDIRLVLEKAAANA